MQELPRILEMAAGQGFSVTLLLIAVYWFSKEMNVLKKDFKELQNERRKEYAEMVKAMTLNESSLQSLADAIEDLKDKINNGKA